MQATKPLLSSRTIWSLVLSVLANILGALGVDVELAQFEDMIEGGVMLSELLVVAFTVAAVYFRAHARSKLEVNTMQKGILAALLVALAALSMSGCAMLPGVSNASVCDLTDEAICSYTDTVTGATNAAIDYADSRLCVSYTVQCPADGRYREIPCEPFDCQIEAGAGDWRPVPVVVRPAD